jgi:hypothetical protein
LPHSFECQECGNLCEVIEIKIEDEVAARWGDRCGKWGVDFKEKLRGRESGTGNRESGIKEQEKIAINK